MEYNLKRAKEKERNQSIYPSKAENFENLLETTFADSVQQTKQQCLEPERLHRYFSHTINNNIVHPRHYTASEIAQSAASGFGQGVRGALEHAVNTGTIGMFDSGSDLFSGGYEQRQKDLEELVAQENLQKPLKYLNYLNDATINAYTLKKLAPFKQIPAYIRMMYRNMK